MSKYIKCAVNRAVMDAGNDLFTFMDRVYAAVVRNFQMFEAENQFDVFPEEIHPKKVIVRNAKSGSYYMADIRDKDGSIELANVKGVKRQWVTLDEVVRADGKPTEHEVLESGVCAVLDRNASPTFWGPVLSIVG